MNSDFYDVVLSDPPWSYHGQQDKWGAAAKFYSTVSDTDLIELARPPLTPRGVLFLWATCPRLDAAMTLIDAWGLTYRGVAFVWVKTRKTDPSVPIGAQGVRPSIVKPTTELVLAASPVQRGRPLPLSDEGIRQVVLAPKTEHSTKPDAVAHAIDRMYPSASKLEMFARRPRSGWAVHGDEVDAL